MSIEEALNDMYEEELRLLQRPIGEAERLHDEQNRGNGGNRNDDGSERFGLRDVGNDNPNDQGERGELEQ